MLALYGTNPQYSLRTGVCLYTIRYYFIPIETLLYGVIIIRMSNPNPANDPNNQYPSDDYKPVRKEFKKTTKKGEIAKKMFKAHGNVMSTLSKLVNGSKNNATRLKLHNQFVKKHPNKHSPYVNYEDFND